MKKTGYMLIAVGFLAGALTTVLDTLEVPWASFVAALAVGFAGIVFVRVSTRREAHAEGASARGIRQLEASLDALVEGVHHIDTDREAIGVHGLHHRIDEVLAPPLAAFAEGRESMAHVFGLQGYADVMSHFAAGERYVNRVWTASTDGYVDETDAYLKKAAAQFEEARALFGRLNG